MTDAKKAAAILTTKDRMAQKIVLEILIDSVPQITIGEAKKIAHYVSSKIRNAFYRIEREGLNITDEQANQASFWIEQIINSGKDYNQKP